MRRQFRVRPILMAALVLFTHPVPALAAPRTPVEAFAALPSFSASALSADGKTLAFTSPRSDGNYDVKLYDFETRRVQVIEAGNNKIRGLNFEDNGKLFIITSNANRDYFEGVGEIFGTTVFDPSDKSLEQLPYSIENVLGKEPNKIIGLRYEPRDENDQRPTLNIYKYDLSNRSRFPVQRGTADTYDWLTDADGNAVARADLNLVGNFTTLHVKKTDGQWAEVVRMPDTKAAGLSLLGLSNSGRVLFMRNDIDEFGKVESVNPATGNIATMVRAESNPLDGVIVDKWTHGLQGVSTGGIDPVTQWLDPAYQEAEAVFASQMPGKTVHLLESTPDKKIFLANVADGSAPEKFYVLNLTTARLAEVGSAMPSLNSIAVGQTRATTFKSRDGVDIPVYVTTPPGHNDAKNAPTIIFPHGGPASRDSASFDWWAQFMASRGYVVIQPQFRGSTGFGLSFERAGERQWGKRMQDDVTDALAWAVKEGATDPNRVCIVGGSYGGYAALAGATLTPDLYKCAVSVAGVSDLTVMLRFAGMGDWGRRSTSLNYWVNHIGADDPEGVKASSPSLLATHVRAPILLIHGKDDSVVPFAQSQIMADALRRANKPYKLVELSGEDHWLSRAETRRQMLVEIEAFLAVNLGPGLE